MTQEVEEFEKIARWEHKSKFGFGEQVIVTCLWHKAGQKNLSINLVDLAIEYAKNMVDLAKQLDPETDYQLSIADTVGKKSRKVLIKGFKRLQKLGFIEVVSSKNWKEHTVNLVPFWES